MTTQQTSTVQVPGARTAPDASAKRDARSAAALPGRALPLGATPGERFGAGDKVTVGPRSVGVLRATAS